MTPFYRPTVGDNVIVVRRPWTEPDAPQLGQQARITFVSANDFVKTDLGPGVWHAFRFQKIDA